MTKSTPIEQLHRLREQVRILAVGVGVGRGIDHLTARVDADQITKAANSLRSLL